MIRLHGVGKSYRESGATRPILHHLDAHFPKGSLTALLGRSGSGKTTLLNLISGIDPPDTGTVVVDGENLTALDEEARTLFRRHRVGFVFQFFNLIPTLTVRENILLPIELTGQNRRPEMIRRADGLLEQVGLAERGNTFPDLLSGGERQRVALVRALAHAPQLVLADEPTGNLDQQSSREILELLVSLVRGHGVTLVVATHSSEVATLADRTLVLRAGRLEGVSPQVAPGANP